MPSEFDIQLLRDNRVATVRIQVTLQGEPDEARVRDMENLLGGNFAAHATDREHFPLDCKLVEVRSTAGVERSEAEPMEH